MRHSQFYTLSKKYHPDLHPDDKTSSQKFVAVSEAYHILGQPEKRQKYDREHIQSRGSSEHSSIFRPGSHSGHTARQDRTGPGGRPASGLSRRRTQFRGPPPSFYQSGGYGANSAKRKAYGEQQSHSEPSSTSSSQTNPSGLGSTPPGSSSSSPFIDPDPNIPYWNKASHLATHDALRQRRERSGSERALGLDEDQVGGSMIVNFILVSGVIVAVAVFTAWIHGRRDNQREKKGANGGGSGKKMENG